MKNRKFKTALFNIGKQPVSGNYYPKDAVEKAIAKFNSKERFVTTEMEVTPRLEHAIGTVKLALEDETVMADMEIFRTKQTEDMWELIRTDCARFKPMGFGTTVNGVVQDDYEIRHIALVGNFDE